jgi:hypothetical protein
MISRFVLGSVIAGIFTLQFYPLDGLGQEMGERLTRFTPEDMHAAPHFATSVIDRKQIQFMFPGSQVLLYN